jgi:hypothetical protein
MTPSSVSCVIAMIFLIVCSAVFTLSFKFECRHRGRPPKDHRLMVENHDSCARAGGNRSLVARTVVSAIFQPGACITPSSETKTEPITLRIGLLLSFHRKRFIIAADFLLVVQLLQKARRDALA